MKVSKAKDVQADGTNGRVCHSWGIPAVIDLYPDDELFDPEQEDQDKTQFGGSDFAPVGTLARNRNEQGAEKPSASSCLPFCSLADRFPCWQVLEVNSYRNWKREILPLTRASLPEVPCPPRWPRFNKPPALLEATISRSGKVVTKTGSGEIPTDPMPIEASDMMVILKDKQHWTSAKSFDELAEKMSIYYPAGDSRHFGRLSVPGTDAIQRTDDRWKAGCV